MQEELYGGFGLFVRKSFYISKKAKEKKVNRTKTL